MMDPLSALSALTNAQAPLQAMEQTAPAGPANAITENFNLLQPAQTSSTAATSALAPISGGSGAGPTTWGHMVQQMVMDVNSKQQNAAAEVNDVLQGGPTPVHQAMVSTEEASLSFEFLSEMRNKVVDAYQQVMQMQV
jgi:flagellar hook-basal body complex protein FliE